MSSFFLIGFMGCGKTSIGQPVAKTVGYDFLDMDDLIEQEQGQKVSVLFSEKGETAFRELERDCLQQLVGFENTIIATGGGVPCFFDNIDFMNQHAETIYLKLTPEQIKIRLDATDRSTRPIIAGYYGEEMLRFIREMLEKREQYYLKAKHILEGDDEEIFTGICRIVREKKAEGENKAE